MVNSDAGSDTMSFSPRNSRQNSSADLYADGGLVSLWSRRPSDLSSTEDESRAKS